MPQITLTNDQKSQLIGYLNREKDFLLSLAAMAERITIPAVTGTLELIRNDLEFVIRLRAAARGQNPAVDLSSQDLETLLDIARGNKFADRDEFWRSIVAKIDIVKIYENPKTESLP